MNVITQWQALSDPTRRRIFELVAAAPTAVGALADQLPISRPAVSQHLKVLSDAGLVTVEQVGTKRIYTAEVAALDTISHWLHGLWDTALDAFSVAARKEHQAMPPIPAVIKTRTVPLPQRAAYDLFTQRLDTWWPLESHSIGADTDNPTTKVHFEPRVGGRVVETRQDGQECSWADVIAWQPHHRFVVAWHPNEQPVAASILEVTFTSVDAGTELRLEHRAWEEFGDEGQNLRDGYENGWEPVLERFTDRAEST